MTDELKPIGPNEALCLYLDHRHREVSDATLRSHKSRLGHFIRWCDEDGIDNLYDLTGRRLHEFRLWRCNQNGGIKPVTEKTQMDTLRVFIRFLETIDAVPRDLSEKVQSPDLGSKENVRDELLERDHAEAVLETSGSTNTRPDLTSSLRYNGTRWCDAERSARLICRTTIPTISPSKFVTALRRIRQ